MFWMANALGWNAKPIVLQTFASFPRGFACGWWQINCLLFWAIHVCNFRHLVTTTYGNLTSVCFLGSFEKNKTKTEGMQPETAATMSKFCKALSDVWCTDFTNQWLYAKFRCTLPQAFNQPSYVHDARIAVHDSLTLRTQEIQWYWWIRGVFGTGTQMARQKGASTLQPEKPKKKHRHDSSCNQCHGQEMQVRKFLIEYIHLAIRLIFFK